MQRTHSCRTSVILQRTPFSSLKQINGASLHVIHVNDYPQAADSSTLNDGNRIYPGDGVAPYR